MQGCHLTGRNMVDGMEVVPAENHDMGILQIGGKGEAVEVGVGDKPYFTSGGNLGKEAASFVVALSQGQANRVGKPLEKQSGELPLLFQVVHIVEGDSVVDCGHVQPSFSIGTF